jgi:hypothetical protein
LNAAYRPGFMPTCTNKSLQKIEEKKNVTGKCWNKNYAAPALIFMHTNTKIKINNKAASTGTGTAFRVPGTVPVSLKIFFFLM